MQPQVVQTENLEAAFRRAELQSAPVTGVLAAAKIQEMFWDSDAETGMSARQTFIRRDDPRSRRRWQFAERQELQGVYEEDQ